jgi:TPR repeat protein
MRHEHHLLEKPVRRPGVVATGFAHSLLAALIACSACSSVRAAAPAMLSADRLMFVDCKLPAPLKRLGGSMITQGPRPIVRSTVDDCEIRGGEYVAYDRANYATALSVWLPQARSGDDQAQIYVGEIYERGLGTAPDYALAAEWYEKAASKNPQGKTHLAYLYEQGLGIPQDTVKALNLYREAAGLKDNGPLVFASVLDAANVRIAELTTTLEDRTNEVETLSGQLDQTQHELADLQAQALKARRTAADLRSQLQKLQSETQSTSNLQEIATLRQQLQEREQQAADQDRKIQALQQSSSQQNAALTQQLAQMQLEDDTLRTSLGSAQGQLATAKSQLAAAQAKQAALQQESAKLGEEQARSERALQSLQAELRNGQASSQKAGDARLAAALAAAQIEVGREQTVIRNLNVEHDKLLDEVKQLESAVQKATNKAGNAAQDATALQAQLASMQGEALQKGREIEALSARIHNDESQIATDRGQLVDAATRLGAKDAEVKRLNQALEERETTIRNERAQQQGLAAAVQSDVAEIKSLQEKLAGTRGPRPAPPVAPGPVIPNLPAGTNYALIIANAHYQDRAFEDLPAVAKDAVAVQGALERYGFKDHTTLLANPTRDEIMNAVARLAMQLGEKDSALIYYAGHGAAVDATNATYWLPKDADHNNRATWVSTGWVTEMIRQMKARHVLVVVDSCYAGAMTHSTNLALVSKAAEDEPKRLRLLASLRSRTVLTSGGNEPVLSNGPGGNSIFAHEFTDILDQNTQVLDASTLYETLSAGVHLAAANLATLGVEGAQQPRYSVLSNAGHLDGDFLFVPAGAGGGSRT